MKMKKLLGINVTEEEFDYLICEQNNGKELKVVDGKVVAQEHILTNNSISHFGKVILYQVTITTLTKTTTTLMN